MAISTMTTPRTMSIDRIRFTGAAVPAAASPQNGGIALRKYAGGAWLDVNGRGVAPGGGGAVPCAGASAPATAAVDARVGRLDRSRDSRDGRPRGAASLARRSPRQRAGAHLGGR